MRRSFTVTMPAGTAGTGAIQLAPGETLIGVIAPAMTSTSLSVTASDTESGTFSSLKDNVGTAYTITVSTSAAGYSYIDPTVFPGVPAFKLVPAASEATQRTLTLVVRTV